MRVRSKTNHAEIWTVIGEGTLYENSAGRECEVYIAYQPDKPAGQHSLVKRCYEPVPADTWRDITGECVNHNDPSILHHKGVFIGELRIGYRFRKVKEFNEQGYPHDYFIVERKETP